MPLYKAILCNIVFRLSKLDTWIELRKIVKSACMVNEKSKHAMKWLRFCPEIWLTHKKKTQPIGFSSLQCINLFLSLCAVSLLH